jgi:hypothetical protein
MFSDRLKLHAAYSLSYASIAPTDPRTHETPKFNRDMTVGIYDHSGIFYLKYISQSLGLPYYVSRNRLL